MYSCFGEQCFLDVKKPEKQKGTVITAARVYAEAGPHKSGALMPCRNYSITLELFISMKMVLLL